MVSRARRPRAVARAPRQGLSRRQLGWGRLGEDVGRGLRIVEHAFFAPTPPNNRRLAASMAAAPAHRQSKTVTVQPDAPLAGVALNYSLPTQSHFTRVFTRLIGISPGQWRRMKSLSGEFQPTMPTPGRTTMRPTSSSPSRRSVLAASAAAGALGLLPAERRAAAGDNAIRPFRINVPEEDLVDLRRRIAATRWPEKETVDRCSPRACSSRPSSSSRATGRPTTTGARSRRGSTRCRSSSPRSMGSTFISFTFARSMKMRCR